MSIFLPMSVLSGIYFNNYLHVFAYHQLKPSVAT